MNYVAPSLTNYRGGNPSYRIYLIDSETKNIVDYEQYRMNMTYANTKGTAVWTLSHKGTQLFNVSDLTQHEAMTQIDVEGEFIKKNMLILPMKKKCMIKKK